MTSMPRAGEIAVAAGQTVMSARVDYYLFDVAFPAFLLSGGECPLAFQEFLEPVSGSGNRPRRKITQTSSGLSALQVGSIRPQAFNFSKGIAQRIGCLAVPVGIGSEALNLSKCIAQRVGGLVVQFRISL
jgi:hypothetical protein